MTVELELVPFGALTDGQLGGIRQIYLEAFPPHHRVPFEHLVDAGTDNIAIAALADRSPVGFAALRPLPSVDWSFLRYFAISAGRRNQGLGYRLWTAMIEHLAGIGAPNRVVLEVEPPDEVEYGSAEWTTRQRRIRFYTRCGASVLGVHGYFVPEEEEGEDEPEPMLLMGTFSAASAAHGPQTRSRSHLRALAVAIYVDHYGLSPDDSLIDELSI